MLKSTSLIAFALTSSLSISVLAQEYSGKVTYGPGALAESQLAAQMERRPESSVSQMRAEADELAEIALMHGYPVVPVEHRIDHELMFKSARYISVLREDFAYTGGASGSIWQIPLNWDREQKSLISVEQLFGTNPETYAALAVLVRGKVISEVWGGAADEWGAAIEAAIQADPEYLSQFTFAPSTRPGMIGGITWHFDPYVVAPGYRGVQSVTVPQRALARLLASTIRPHFAGQPVRDLVSVDSIQATETYSH